MKIYTIVNLIITLKLVQNNVEYIFTYSFETHELYSITKQIKKPINGFISINSGLGGNGTGDT